MKNTSRRIEIMELADENGLDWIEITEGRNGYPERLHKAIIGFDSFDKAAKFAEKYNLETKMFHKKDGWQLWEDQGWVNKPIEVTEEMYGDNYKIFPKMEESEFFEMEVEDVVNEIDNFNDLIEFVNDNEDIWEKIDQMEDDELVIAFCGNYSDTVKNNSLSWNHDTNNYLIGVK